jgi:plasmid maintenance system antidote protein VapI
MTWVSPPGASISDALEELGLSIQEFSVAVKMTVEQVKDLIAGKVVISEALAERLSEVVGATTAFWLRREMSYRMSLCEQSKERMTTQDDLNRSNIDRLNGAISEIEEAFQSMMFAAPEMQEEVMKRMQAAIEYASRLRIEIDK